jgi:hypothetical protein
MLRQTGDGPLSDGLQRFFRLATAPAARSLRSGPALVSPLRLAPDRGMEPLTPNGVNCSTLGL